MLSKLGVPHALHFDLARVESEREYTIAEQIQYGFCTFNSESA
jgi:hypothetical protein